MSGIGLKRTLGGLSKAACSSRIRLFDPLTRKVPAISVAGSERKVGHFKSRADEHAQGRTVLLQEEPTGCTERPFSVRYDGCRERQTHHFATTTGI